MNDWWRCSQGATPRNEKLPKFLAMSTTKKWLESEQKVETSGSSLFTFWSNKFFISSKLSPIFYRVRTKFRMVLDFEIRHNFFANFLYWKSQRFLFSCIIGTRRNHRILSYSSAYILSFLLAFYSIPRISNFSSFFPSIFFFLLFSQNSVHRTRVNALFYACDFSFSFDPQNGRKLE